MDLPNSATVVKIGAVAFALGEQPPKVPYLTPGEWFEVLQGALKSAKPYLKYLSLDSFGEIFGGTFWNKPGELPECPRGLTEKTKCFWVFTSKGVSDIQVLLVTRSCGLFLWDAEQEDAASLPNHQIATLSKEKFLDEFQGRYPEVVRRVLGQLSRLYRELRSKRNAQLVKLQNASRETAVSLVRLSTTGIRQETI